MLSDLYPWIPAEGVKILLVLGLSFLIGLEREEKRAGDGHYIFGGVRTFPLIGLIGYATAVVSGGQPVPLTLGLVAVAAFLTLSYWHKLRAPEGGGVTSEMSGLATYLVGALVSSGQFWIATTLGVTTALLLEFKTGLERLSQRVAPEEILTVTKFLVLAAIILPILPNHDFGPFRLNPFKTWLVVVAVSAVSGGSYVLQRLTKGQGGVILAALLGGAYSSTVTTVVLARRAAREAHASLFAGATLMASGIMYLRLAVLVGLFNRDLLRTLAPSFVLLAGLAAAAGWLWTRRADAGPAAVQGEFISKNPLDLRAAFLFALLFLAMLVATHLALVSWGRAGVFGLAALMGVTDVDPFILGMTQAAGTLTPVPMAAAGILIAAASNNVAKGMYACALARRQGGMQSLCLLLVLAALGLTPLAWLAK